MHVDAPAAEIAGTVLGWTTSPRTAVKMSVKEYLGLLSLQAFQEGDPVELLEGVMTQKMIKNPRHAIVTDALHRILCRVTPAEWFVSGQNPMMTADSVPEPDLKIVRGQLNQFISVHPKASDLALVIEVADSSLLQDRGTKQRIYARAKVPVYWIVNLIDDVVEVYTYPTARPTPHYKNRLDYSSGQKIPLMLDGKKIANLKVEDFLL